MNAKNIISYLICFIILIAIGATGVGLVVCHFAKISSSKLDQYNRQLDSDLEKLREQNRITSERNYELEKQLTDIRKRISKSDNITNTIDKLNQDVSSDNRKIIERLIKLRNEMQNCIDAK